MRLILPALLLLAGCSMGADVNRSADGRSYVASCGGPFNTKLDCNTAASRTCPKGFTALESPPARLMFTCGASPSQAHDPTVGPM